MASVAQLVARKSHNLKVPGSIPGGGILTLLVNNVSPLHRFYDSLAKIKAALMYSLRSSDGRATAF